MLIVSRKANESIIIGDNIEIIISEIGPDKVKIGINAPKDIPIIRKELIEASLMNIEASVAPNENSILDLKKLFGE